MSRPLMPCGTPAAWKRHKRRREPIDDACRNALRADSRDRARRHRAQAPTGTCKSCRRDRPIERHGWCNSCLTRWYGAGRPDGGPPPPRPAEEVQAMRALAAREGYAVQLLNRAIQQGGWEWAA